jgi:FkbM family methyltransferase
VHAFEPVPVTFERLRVHVAGNGLERVVRLNRAALWHVEETVTLGLKPDMLDNLGSYSIGAGPERVEAVSAAGLPLDQYFEKHQIPRFDIMKMDIEGAEVFALHGAARSLARWRPVILMEVNRQLCRALGYVPQRIWECLAPLGYRIWSVAPTLEQCRELPNLDKIERANVIFHTAPLPEALTQGWTLKGILRSHRRQAGYR